MKGESGGLEEAVLYRKIAVPEPFVTVEADGRRWGGDIRIGDLTGSGNVEFLVYKSLGGMKPSFLGAFDLAGESIWSVGDARFSLPDAAGGEVLHTESPGRPGPVAVCDLDGDGATEVVCMMVDFDADRTSRWEMGETRLVLLDGRTGAVKREAVPEAFRGCTGYVDGELHLSNYVHQRLVVANFRGLPQARDFVVKLGNTVLAFSDTFELLWSYSQARWYRYPGHAAYTPAVGDLDGDGRDEVNGGQYGLDHDGRVLWEKDLGENVDSVLVEAWAAEGGKRAVVSGGGRVLDGRGNAVLELGTETVPHGQEIRCGDVRADSPGPELIVRYNGHHPDLMVVSRAGKVLCRFQADESPNNTGLEVVRWGGPSEWIYSPAALFDGYGRKAVTFPGLPPPVGGRMGWYHCFPADVCGDAREEVVLYNPDSDCVYVYTAAPFDAAAFGGYRHTPRQYNARLID